MGFYSNISKISFGDLSPNGTQMFDGEKWIPYDEAGAKVEQHLRRHNKECAPYILYGYINKKDNNRVYTMTIQAEMLKIGDHICRGFFNQKDRFIEMCKDGILDWKDIEKDYDSSYCIYDDKYLKGNEYVPSILK